MESWPAVLRDLLSPLASELSDPDITDILVDGTECVRVDHVRDGRLNCGARFHSGVELTGIVHLLADMDGAEVVGDHVTVRLPDGSRVHAIAAGLAHRGQGPWISIRRFRRSGLDAAALIRAGAIASAAWDWLSNALVEERMNVVVAGPVGSGKTTLAELLLREVSPDERVLILQDVEEIVPPCAGSAWGSFRPGPGGYEALLASMLRMQPDRLAVGEVRGAEAWVMLDALVTGHPGGITTVHAHSAVGALRRLETLCLQHPHAPDLKAIRARIAEGVQVVVQTGRRAGPPVWRGVEEIIEVKGVDSDGNWRVETKWRRGVTKAA